jgi:hypothetical protein
VGRKIAAKIFRPWTDPRVSIARIPRKVIPREEFTMDTPEFIMPITSNRRSHCGILLAGAGLATGLLDISSNYDE